jgi:hypothetical protein
VCDRDGAAAPGAAAGRLRQGGDAARDVLGQLADLPLDALGLAAPDGGLLVDVAAQRRQVPLDAGPAGAHLALDAGAGRLDLALDALAGGGPAVLEAADLAAQLAARPSTEPYCRRRPVYVARRSVTVEARLSRATRAAPTGMRTARSA